jgi:hypothetical protein
VLEFRQLAPDNAALGGSPLLRALDYLDQGFADNPNGIPLTKGGAFKRGLIADAIRVIQWPDWTEAEIYYGFMPIKVVDEQHFEPFRELHYRLIRAKLARHLKGKLVLTKHGRSVFEHRFQRFHLIVQHMLFRDPYLVELRHRRDLIGNWDIWLNVIDIVAAHGASGRELERFRIIRDRIL